jgi:predicted TIM-barrel fold metal-dependent hydrolase
MSSAAFYDTHCHALTLSHPSFLAFTQTLRRRGLEEVYSQITSPNYLVAALFFKAGERMRNMLAVMERDVGSIFELMEDDLSGMFARLGDGKPLLKDGVLRLGALRYDRLVLCPLIMDFQCATFMPSEGTYYHRPSTKRLAPQVRDVLEGIRAYRRARPDGFLEIRPFLGVDTRHYSAGELAALLETAFDGLETGSAASREAASRRAFEAMRDYDAASPAPGLFAGIKVYPPLGFDPWPDGGSEREKVELLWSFCESRDLPVVTHCDDQGFRVARIEDAWLFSSPLRWEAVLRSHPGLRLDFAHFGIQYSHPIGRPASTVYADFSFDGTDPEYYSWLDDYLGHRSAALAGLIEERLLFGSDFTVNLTKIRSYSDYFRLYENAPLSDELKGRFARDNPERFLFG